MEAAHPLQPRPLPRAGAAATRPGALALPLGLLGRLMPMFLWLGPEGQVRAMGPTLAKLFPGRRIEGAAFFDLFDVTRPRRLRSMAELADHATERLHLRLRSAPRTLLRGLALPFGTLPSPDPAAEAPSGGGLFLNLSFGLSVAEAVRAHALSDGDFAPTDLTVEMLYLIEAKSAVMGELRGLTLRLEQARRAAEEEALSDALTGLANRRALEQALDQAAQVAARTGPQAGGEAGAPEGAPFALAHLDLDFFKTVNDTLGHAAGDAVLARVATVLRDETRKQDLVARIGGDEFVLLLRGQTDPARLEALARRIIARLEEPIPFEGQAARISASLGFVLSTDYPHPAAERLLADADRALYASKRRGRARCTILRPGEVLPEDQRDG